MSGTVIQIENISKRYQLGELSSGTISRDLSRWWSKKFKGDISQQNTGLNLKEEIWALQHISFDVKHGEVLGIIGGNGAGKSTLLKILSRVTKPTTGKIRLKGRIASLLEVGTGFHPDLTGRENIFLNGAILGMNKPEIRSKMDEIVTFAGVERYLDTPVKRYSSGMYVRLAFAVAAHLEPEILIIDEVLAVGDRDFQNKCLGKMKEVSNNHGRTILFVSHNMASVKSLCSRALLLKNGHLIYEDTTDKVIDTYLHNLSIHQSEFYFNINPGLNASLSYLKIEDVNNTPVCSFLCSDPWQIKIGFKVLYPSSSLIVAIGILTTENVAVRTIWSSPFTAKIGNFEALFYEDQIIYAAGTYRIVVSLAQNNHTFQFINTDIFVVFEENIANQQFVKSKDTGLILNQMNVQINQIYI